MQTMAVRERQREGPRQGPSLTRSSFPPPSMTAIPFAPLAWLVGGLATPSNSGVDPGCSVTSSALVQSIPTPALLPQTGSYRREQTTLKRTRQWSSHDRLQLLEAARLSTDDARGAKGMAPPKESEGELWVREGPCQGPSLCLFKLCAKYKNDRYLQSPP